MAAGLSRFRPFRVPFSVNLGRTLTRVHYKYWEVAKGPCLWTKFCMINIVLDSNSEPALCQMLLSCGEVTNLRIWSGKSLKTAAVHCTLMRKRHNFFWASASCCVLLDVVDGHCLSAQVGDAICKFV